MVEYSLLVALLAAILGATVYYLGGDIADALCKAFSNRYDRNLMRCVEWSEDPG